MTYEELVMKVKTACEKLDASKITEHVAIQFNVTGEAEGALYVEISAGKVYVEPYEYYDRDMIVTSSAKDLIAIATGEIEMVEAFKTGNICSVGNMEKAVIFNDLIKSGNMPAEKKTAKKAVAKKSNTKKAANRKK